MNSALPSAASDLLRSALAQVCAEEGSILLAEPAGLRFALCVAPAAPEHESKLVGILVPRGRGIVGLAFAFQQPMTVADVKSDPTHDQSVDALAGSHTRSEAVVPLSTPEKEYGMLTAINAASPGGFSAADLDVLTTCAAAVTVLLAKAEAQVAPQGGRHD
jgi:GAF domain-containing protein